MAVRGGKRVAFFHFLKVTSLACVASLPLMSLSLFVSNNKGGPSAVNSTSLRASFLGERKNAPISGHVAAPKNSDLGRHFIPSPLAHRVRTLWQCIVPDIIALRAAVKESVRGWCTPLFERYPLLWRTTRASEKFMNALSPFARGYISGAASLKAWQMVAKYRGTIAAVASISVALGPLYGVAAVSTGAAYLLAKNPQHLRLLFRKNISNLNLHYTRPFTGGTPGSFAPTDIFMPEQFFHMRPPSCVRKAQIIKVFPPEPTDWASRIKASIDTLFKPAAYFTSGMATTLALQYGYESIRPDPAKQKERYVQQILIAEKKAEKVGEEKKRMQEKILENPSHSAHYLAEWRKYVQEGVALEEKSLKLKQRLAALAKNE